jgi:ribonuclease-3
MQKPDLGYLFKDRGLLTRALTHTSAARKPAESNERLEFLGDRILNMLVAEMLDETFPNEREGDVAKRLTTLVCAPALADVAQQIGLQDHLILSAAEAASGGAHKQNMLADAIEAIVAAMYKDGGLDAPRVFVRTHWASRLNESTKPPQDAKSALQEWAQGRGLPLPLYDVMERSGPDHAPVFTITVSVEGQPTVQGTGASKRDAEKAAAEALLEILQ